MQKDATNFFAEDERGRVAPLIRVLVLHKHYGKHSINTQKEEGNPMCCFFQIT